MTLGYVFLEHLLLVWYPYKRGPVSALPCTQRGWHVPVWQQKSGTLTVEWRQGKRKLYDIAKQPGYQPGAPRRARI